MGTWGEKSIENDAAADALAELEAGGIAELRRILSNVADTAEDEYLDVDDGSAAIAAAEIVAAASGHGRDRVPKRLGAWLDANASLVGPADVTLARRAVERVLAENSELRGLWDERGPDTAWHADVRRLLLQLGGDPGAPSPKVNAGEIRAPEKRYANEKSALFAFLGARGLEPSEAQRKRILGCHDGAEIRRWLDGVMSTPSVAALLGEKD
jgi:hypothetical protein